MATKHSRAGAGANVAPQQYRVLLIAPHTELEHVEAEQQHIINALHPEVAIGTVTVSDVLDCVQRGSFDVVWFLGHSGPTGIQLSDGTLSPAHLAQILRQSPPQLVVLNSCSSLHIAMQIHDDLQAAVICTVLDIPDLDAYITGAGLARALAAGLDVTTAYNQSRPSANRQYVLLNGSVRMNGQTEFDDLHRLILRSYADLQREFAEMRQEVTAVRLEQAAAADRYHRQLTRPRALAWGAGFILFMLAYAVLEFRDVLDLHAPQAIAVSLFVAAVSCWLLLWGLGFRLDK